MKILFKLLQIHNFNLKMFVFNALGLNKNNNNSSTDKNITSLDNITSIDTDTSPSIDNNNITPGPLGLGEDVNNIIPMVDKPLDLIDQYVNSKAGFLNFTLVNKHMLEGKDLVYAIHNFLYKNKDFIAFGDYKIVFISAENEEYEFNFHPNILVNNNTSLDTYYEKTKNLIEVSDYAYNSTVITYLFIKVWNVDDYRNSEIKVTRNHTNKKFKFQVVKRSFSKAKGKLTKFVGTVVISTILFKIFKYILFHYSLFGYNYYYLLLTIGMIILILIIFYYIFNLILLFFFSKLEIKIKKNLPSLIYNKLDTINDLANSVVYKNLFRMYLFEIIFYSLILILIVVVRFYINPLPL